MKRNPLKKRNPLNSDAWSLVKASRDGDFDAVKELVNLGANPMDDGCAAISAASASGHIKIVEFLVEIAEFLVGYEIGQWDCKNAIVSASCNGHKHVVEFLIRKGFKINREDSLLAFRYAALCGYTEIIKMISDLGTKPNSDILYLAISNGSLQTAKMMLENGVNFRGRKCFEILGKPDSRAEAISRIVIKMVTDK